MRYYLLIIFWILMVCRGNTQNRDCSSLDTNLCYSIGNFPEIDFDIKRKFRSIDNVMLYQSPLLMDIDNDCIPEIIIASEDGYQIGPPRLSKNILIIDSQTGITKKKIVTAYFNWSTAGSYVLADVDNDGAIEVIVVAADVNINETFTSGKLVCYDMDGNIKWVSDQKYGKNLEYRYGGTPSLADFNQDGTPEVYIYNEIFNAKTGRKLVDGGLNGKGMRTAYTSSGSNSLSIAGYFDDDDTDLELAAGFTIYKVLISNIDGTQGNSMIPYNFRLNGRLIDGMTSMADINLDGRMDVVVTSDGDFPNAKIYVYSLIENVPTLIAQASPSRGQTNCCPDQIGPAVIGNLLDTKKPTICVNRPSKLLAYNYNGTTNLQLIWDLPTNDISGVTGLTMFDFDQDGFHELVYRDETNLRIIDARTNPPRDLASFSCFSGTGLEFPIIGDIDNTGVSKICVTCGTSRQGSGASVGKIEVYEAKEALHAWAPSRGIWNQYNYHIFNINDDLTIPSKMKNNATYQEGFFNSIYVQKSLINEDKDYLQKAPDLGIHMNTFNHCISYDSISSLFEIVFTVFNTEFASQDLNIPINISIYDNNPSQNGKLIKKLVFDEVILAGSHYHIVTTLDSLPQSQILFVVLNYNGGNLGSEFTDSGFDIAECTYENNIFEFNFSEFVSFINVDICKNDKYDFFDIELVESGLYVKTHTVPEICDSLTILNLSVVDIFRTSESYIICDGDSLQMGNQWVYDDFVYTQNLLSSTGCDSTHIITVQKVIAEPIVNFIDLCKGDSVRIGQQWYFDATSIENIIDAEPCPLFRTTYVRVNESYYFDEVRVKCPKDSIFFHDRLISEAGIYPFNYLTSSGCDSVYLLEVTEVKEPSYPSVTTDCERQVYLLNIDENDSWTHQWSHGYSGHEVEWSTDSDITVTYYHIDEECEVEYRVALPEIPSFQDIPWIGDTVVYPGKNIEYIVHLDPDFWQIQWRPSSVFGCDTCFENSVLVLNEVSASLTLVHVSGCEYSRTFNIQVDDTPDLIIPNIFAPDGSPANNRWTIYIPDCFVIEFINIYDRWGNQVSEMKYPMEVEWEGSFNGRQLEQGVYTYIIKYRDPSGAHNFKAGDVTLVR